MAHDVISTCPVCSRELAVTRLHCNSCGTVIEGEFTVGRFGRLDREQLGLLESFLRKRGNLRELERELRLSYPTVRARLDGLLRALGLAVDDGALDEPDDAQSAFTGAATAGGAPATQEDDSVTKARLTILQRLADHEISADEAATAIRALGGAFAWPVSNER